MNINKSGTVALIALFSDLINIFTILCVQYTLPKRKQSFQAQCKANTAEISGYYVVINGIEFTLNILNGP